MPRPRQPQDFADPEQHAGLAMAYGQDPLVVGLSYLSWARVLQGDEPGALASLERALHRAETLGHAFSLAFALYSAAVLHDLRGEFSRVLKPTRSSSPRSPRSIASRTGREAGVSAGERSPPWDVMRRGSS